MPEIADIPQQVDVPPAGGQPDPQKGLYDKLFASHLYTKTFDDFKQKYSDTAAREKLYSGLSGSQLYTKSKEDFDKQYFSQSAPAQENVNQATVPEKTEMPSIPGWTNTNKIVSGANDALSNGSDSHQLKVKEAEGVVHNAWNNMGEIVKDHILYSQEQSKAMQAQAPISDNTLLARNLPPILKAQEEKAKREAIPDEAVKSVVDNQNMTRPLLHLAIRKLANTGKDKESRALMASVYALDSDQRASDSPEKKKTIEKNINDLKDGSLIYNANTKDLVKPAGLFESISNGHKNWYKSYQGGMDLAGMSMDDKMKYLQQEDGKKETEQDTPIPANNTVGNMIGSEGLTFAKGMVAAGAAGFVSENPLVAAGAYTAATSDDIGYRAYHDEALRTFSQVRQELSQAHPEMSKDDIDKVATEKADHNGKVAAAAGMTTNAAMSVTGTRLGAATKGFSSGVIKAADKVSEGYLSAMKKSLPEALMNSGIAGGAEMGKNLESSRIGVKRDTFEGVPEAAGQMMVLHHVLGAAIHATGSLKKTILQGLSKKSPAEVAGGVNDLVSGGHITPEEGHSVLSDIANHSQKDAQVPSTVNNEQARLHIQDNLDKINENKIKMGKPEDGGLHESFHAPIKDENARLEWENNMLAAKPEDQVKILKEKKQELESKLDSHNEAKQAGKPGTLDYPDADRGQLKDVSKKLDEVQAKLDDPLYKAAKIIGEGNIKGFSKDILEEAAANDHEKLNSYLKDISEQLHDPNSRQTAVDTYGEKLSSIIEEMYPKKEGSRISVIQPKDNKAPLVVKPEDARNPVYINSPEDAPIEPPSLNQKIVLNKDVKEPFTTSSGNHIVSHENGELVVRNAKNPEESVSKYLRKKALKEYAKHFDYSHGEASPEVPDSISHEGEAKRFVVENSENPHQLAEIYANEEPATQPLSTKEQFIADFGIGKVSSDSYNLHGDRNNVTPEIKRTYFSKDGSKGGGKLDVIAKDMSDHHGVEITPQDLVDFMGRFPNGEKDALKLTESDISRQAAEKFKKLTGLELNHETAADVVNQKFEKLSHAEQELANANYETAKELQDAYWDEHEATNGFTKEVPDSKVEPAKGAEDGGEKVTGIKNAVTLAERTVKGFGEVEVQARRDFGEVFEKGKAAVDNGDIDPGLLAKEMAIKPRPMTAEEGAALIYDRMRLKNEHKAVMEAIEEARAEGNDVKVDLLKSQLNDVEDSIGINDEAARKTGYEQGLGLAARKMMIKEDYSLANQVQRYKMANEGRDITPEVRAKLEEQTKKLDEALKKIDEHEKTIAELRAKKNIDDAAKAKKTNSSKDYKGERKTIYDSIKKKWKDASNDGALTVVPLPYAKQLGAISPDVARLIKSYAEQGIVKLADIVKDIHGELTANVHPDITEKDVVDLLAGVYKDKKVAPVLDRQAMTLKANAEKIKNQIDAEKEKIRLANRTKGKIAIDYFQAWRRFMLLSGVKVMGKLNAAAATRALVVTPLESLVGEGLRRIPGIKQIARKAAREGAGFSPKAEAKALTQWVDKITFKDIRQTLKGGKGELDYLYSGKVNPPAHFLDFFGQLHGAIKTIPKRAEFFRSFELRAQHAAKAGKDLTDPFVQQEIGVASYGDAMRAIFMQENYVVSGYKGFLRTLEDSKSVSGRTAAEVAKFMFPIIKVPTNYVAEEISYMIGGLKVAHALRNGIKNLTPEQSDYVMRAFKKQTIGAAFVLMGYFNPSNFGGYYMGKRKSDDLQASDIVIGGIHLPHWASHTPLLEALQLGSTLRRVKDRENQKQGGNANALTGIPTAAKGIMEQVPFFGQSSQTTTALGSLDGTKKYLFRMGQSVVEPQLIKEIAEFNDTDAEGKTIKRDPDTFLEQLKTGIPGLRESVKAKKTSGGGGAGASGSYKKHHAPSKPTRKLSKYD